MTTLVVGASGATGRLLVRQLLERGEDVRVIVRTPDSISEYIERFPNLSVTTASLLNLSDDEIAEHVNGCRAVASCLGHNLTFKGMFGKPRRLVTDATTRLCQAIRLSNPSNPVKFVLMNTAGNRNRDLKEPRSLPEECVIGMIRLLIPPHADNEQAADYLRIQIGGADSAIQWAAVRPDGLINAEKVTEYDIHPSPTRSAIFNSGTTSRINVAHFMAELILNESIWENWKGRMPVIYNRSTEK